MAGDGEELEWRQGRTLPLSELTFRSDTAGGPGGQHANRSATRVTLLWTPAESSAFSQQEKTRLATALASRLSSLGVLQVRSSGERSQRRNRDECLEILVTLIRRALQPQRKRVPTRRTTRSIQRRLDSKRRRAQTKTQRRRPPPDDAGS